MHGHTSKEMQDLEWSSTEGLDWEDFGARMYDPVVGRWWSVDPLAQSFTNVSPYASMFNNPISFIDPTGMAPQDWVGCTDEKGATTWRWDENIKSEEQAKAEGYDGYKAPGSIIDNAKISGLGGADGQTSVYLGFGPNDYSFTWPNKTVTPFQIGTEWLSGNGPRNRKFTHGDIFTEMLKQHEHVSFTRDVILNEIAKGTMQGNNPYGLGGVEGVGKYLMDYSTLLTGGLTGNLGVTYLGSYNLKWEVKGVFQGFAIIQFSVNNSSTMQSASRPPILGYYPWWQNSVGVYINQSFQSGWGSTTTQTFIWTESMPIK
jgi:RHS repeat-associated protein